MTSTKPRKLPKQSRSKVTFDCILEGAAQVFEAHGYAAGTTNRIAERAGVSVGSIYQYFPNKDAILVALIDRHIEESRARLKPLAVRAIEGDLPLEDGLTMLIQELASIHREQPNLHRVLFEESPRPAELRSKLEEVEAQSIAMLAAYLDSHSEVTAPDAAVAARLTSTVLEAVTHRVAIANISAEVDSPRLTDPLHM